MIKYALFCLVGLCCVQTHAWQQGVEIGGTEFRGEKVYQVGITTESPKKFQWRLAYSWADTPDEDILRDWDSRDWYQLSFQQAWQLPLWRVHWFVGGSYTVDEDGKKAPGLGSKANFHLGLYRDLGQNWRLSIRHDSNGDLATKECSEFNGERVCTGTNNTGLNFLTLQRRF